MMNDKTNLIDSVQSLRDRWMATTRHDGHDGDFDILLEVIAALKKPHATPWDQELIAKDARISELTAEIASTNTRVSQPQPVAQGHVSDGIDGDTVLSFANETSIYSIVKHDEGHQLVHTEGGALKLISKPFTLVAQGEAVHPVDAVWQAIDKVSCPGVYMKIAAEAVASAIARPCEPPQNVPEAKSGRYFGRVPPRWYTQQEIEHCLQRMSYSEPVIAELAPWFHRHIKSAFDKGYNMALGLTTPTVPTGHRVVPVEPDICAVCDGRFCPACDPASELMPIETAPKDGTHILLVKLDPSSTGFGWPNGIHQPTCEVCHWFNDGFYSSNFGVDQENPWADFTHWTRIPSFAEASEAGGV